MLSSSCKVRTQKMELKQVLSVRLQRNLRSITLLIKLLTTIIRRSKSCVGPREGSFDQGEKFDSAQGTGRPKRLPQPRPHFQCPLQLGQSIRCQRHAYRGSQHLPGMFQTQLLLHSVCIVTFVGGTPRTCGSYQEKVNS